MMGSNSGEQEANLANAKSRCFQMSKRLAMLGQRLAGF